MAAFVSLDWFELPLLFKMNKHESLFSLSLFIRPIGLYYALHLAQK